PSAAPIRPGLPNPCREVPIGPSLTQLLRVRAAHGQPGGKNHAAPPADGPGCRSRGQREPSPGEGAATIHFTVRNTLRAAQTLISPAISSFHFISHTPPPARFRPIP